MKGISVIICCYNSENKIIPTLDHLAKQKKISNIKYEIVIVDNNCEDNTIDIIHSTWSSLDNPFPLTVVKQPLSGLNNARYLGVKKSLYNYIILCDDDNWLCEDYLHKVYHLFEVRPDVALIGGVGEPVTDAPVPEWFNQLNGYGYAVGAHGRPTGNTDSIYGAGMALNKNIFLSVINTDFPFILSDRKGKELSSGGDTEICFRVQKAGYKIYFDKSLIFKHYLNKDRLRWSYYLKLRRSFGKADAYLQLYNTKYSAINRAYKTSRIKQYLSLIRYIVINIKYLIFQYHFKNEDCARFAQQTSTMMTRLKENQQIKLIANNIERTINKKQLLTEEKKIQ